ncbi:hypothetical protein RCO48_32925 [Peribacillus frigoritolerans]|nr:hypothetical protein [Peribacillus frigoritolerans]
MELSVEREMLITNASCSQKNTLVGCPDKVIEDIQRYKKRNRAE